MKKKQPYHHKKINENGTPSKSSFKNANFNTKPLRQIIKDLWSEYDYILYRYENRDVDVDYRSVLLVKALKKLPVWKSNIFILYLYYEKPAILAPLLNVKPACLSVIICLIKKEIKELLQCPTSL